MSLVFFSNPNMSQTFFLQELQSLLIEHKSTLFIAEGMTGGLIASEFVSLPEGGKCLLGSIVLSSKIPYSLLNVTPEVMEKHGIPSAEVTLELIEGLKKVSGVSKNPTLFLAITGVLDIDREIKKGHPLGTTFISMSYKGVTVSNEKVFESLATTEIDRSNDIRLQAMDYIWRELVALVTFMI